MDIRWLHEIVQHPLDHVRLIKRLFPDAFDLIDEVRRHRHWPKWCFAPINKLSPLIPWKKVREIKDRGFDINPADVISIAGWRATQGIYLFDPAIIDSLWDTPLNGNIPRDVLTRLPEWCPYIAFPKPQTFMNMPIYGFWSWLDYDDTDSHPITTTLALVLDQGIEHARRIFPLPLIGSLKDSLKMAIECCNEATEEDEDKLYLLKKGNKPKDVKFFLNNPSSLAPLVSLVLYLCSTKPDVQGRKDFDPPYHPFPTHTRHGDKIFPPEQPMLWNVGYRIGTLLRHTVEEPKEKTPDQGGTHARPRPHVRKAHWHTFWTGPRDGEQTARLHWLHPMLINEEFGLIPTIHPVIE